MFRWIVAAIFLGLPAVAAENPCATRDDQILKALYPDAARLGDAEFAVGERKVTPPGAAGSGEDLAMVCRQWPAHPDRLLVAVPLMQDAGADAQQGDLELAVMDAETLEIRARLRLPDFLIGDAIQLTGITFDTAYYDLFGDGPAFGIRLDYQGSSRANPFAQQVLSLFDHRDGALRPVLENLVVARSGGEWDLNCAGRFHDISRSIEIADQRHNGAADLTLRPRETRSISEMNGGECEASEVAPDSPLPTVTLRYDGASYPVPPDLRGF